MFNIWPLMAACWAGTGRGAALPEAPRPTPLGSILSVMLAPLAANAELDAILQDARAFAAAARASNTRRAYAAQWRGFVAWCAAIGLRPARRG